MTIPHSHVDAHGVAPSTYSLFPLLCQSLPSRIWSADNTRVIHCLTYYLILFSIIHLPMEDSQHPRRRARSSNGSQAQVTGLGLTTPPDNPPEKPKEVATGFTEIYGAVSPRKAAVISSFEIHFSHKTSLLIYQQVLALPLAQD